MGTLHGMMIAAVAAWATITVMLMIVLFYRSMLVNGEEDQPYLDPAERSLAHQQRALVTRIERLTRPIRALLVLWGIFLMAALTLWLWEGLGL